MNFLLYSSCTPSTRWSSRAAPRHANRPDFAVRARREVVVQHQLLAVLVLQAIDPLLVARGAQHHGNPGLRLAALEHGRAVDPRQHIPVAFDVAERAIVAA